MATGSTGSSGFPKWQLAILLSAPIAIGLGYLLYKRQNSIQDKTSKKTLEALKNKSISIDGKDEQGEKCADEKRDTNEEEAVEETYSIKQATVLKNKGNVCFRKAKYDEAISYYDKAIEKCPPENKADLAIFYQNRAAAYEMLQRWNQVKADCTKSIEYNPRYTKAYYRRAKAHEQTKDLLDCLDDVTATCILEVFQNNNSIAFADRILKQTGQNDAVEGMKNRVHILPSNNFLKMYFKSFDCDPLKKIIVYSSEPKGFIGAKMAWDNCKYEEIIPACTEEIESNDSESEYKTEARLLRGTLYLLMGNYAAAQSDFDAIIKNEDVDASIRVNALVKRASLLMQLEKKDESFADYELAVKLNPNNADIYHHRAQTYTMLDQLAHAIIDYERAIKYSSDSIKSYVQMCYLEYKLAFLAQDQMRLLSVMNDFKNVLEKNPDSVECFSFMAQVLSDQGQFEQADSFFDKAIKMSPDYAPLLVQRGIMWLQWKGDVNKAVDLISTAIEIDEKCDMAYETLGTIEVQRANLERAVELFEKAIKFAKNQTEMAHLYALRNAAISQINVTQKLKIDISSLSAIAESTQVN